MIPASGQLDYDTWLAPCTADQAELTLDLASLFDYIDGNKIDFLLQVERLKAENPEVADGITFNTLIAGIVVGIVNERTGMFK